MSIQIPDAMVEQYAANVQMLSQQKESRLENAVRVEDGIVGESAFFDQIGAGEAQDLVTRHADTPYQSTPHARRRVTLTPAVYADLIDKADKVRTLINASSAYAKAGAYAMNRKKDDRIIEAALGTAYTGKKGATATAFDTTNQLVAANATGLTLAKLIDTKEIFGTNDVDEDIPLHIAVTAKQITDLLNEDKITSQDYASVKALIKGEIKDFMGFEFHRIQRLNKVGSDRQCFAWAEDGILLGVGENVVTEIERLATKNYSVQVYVSMDVGATRMEEKKVVRIDCQE